MVTTPSISSDHEAKRQRLTLEKSKVVTVSISLGPIICVFSDRLPLFDIVPYLFIICLARSSQSNFRYGCSMRGLKWNMDGCVLAGIELH